MKTILNILRECKTDAEMLYMICFLVMSYIIIFGMFYNYNWMCGVLSPYVTTSVLSAGMKLYKYIEKHGDETED